MSVKYDYFECNTKSKTFCLFIQSIIGCLIKFSKDTIFVKYKELFIISMDFKRHLKVVLG